MKTFINIIRVLLVILVIEVFLGHENSLFASNIGTNQVVEDTTKLTKEIEEITISAFRTPYQWLDIPAPINYISTNQLQTGNSISPVEAINRVPGIIMHSGTLNTNRLTIRGVGSRSPYTTNKIKAYFGDIPLTSGDGETTLEDIEPLGIEQVEIIKGPSSSLYGAGLGGTILFYPKVIKNSFVRNESTIASFGTFKNTASLGIKLKKASIYSLLSNLSSDGFRENNSTNRDNFLLYSQVGKAESVSGSVLMKLTRMKAFIPSSLDRSTFDKSPQSAASNWLGVKGFEEYRTGQLGASLNINNRKKSKFNFSVFTQFRNANELRPFNKLEESSYLLGLRGYYQKSFVFNEWELNFISGYEVFREKYDWETFKNDQLYANLSDNEEKRNYENLFFQVEGNKNNRFIISAGINYNNTRYRYTDHFLENGNQSSDYGYDPIFSQRLGLNLKLKPTLSLFLNSSHGFSPPTLAETLLPEGEINPEIRPEQGWNFEGGIRGSIQNRATLELSYYRMYITDLLVARRTGEDAYVGVNAGQSVHPGLEAAWNLWFTSPGVYPSLSWNGNITLANYHFSEFIDNGVDYSGKLLPGTSKVLSFTGVSFNPIQSLNFKASLRYTGKMPVNDANSDFSSPATVSNIEVSFQPKLGKLSLVFKAGVNNVFDEKYASMLAINAPSFGGKPPRYYYPGNPRNFFVTATIGLQ